MVCDWEISRVPLCNTLEVITDNNLLTYILTTAKLDATGQRWITSLSDCNFPIKYRSGRKNADADGLSRRQRGETEERTIFPDVIKAVTMSVYLPIFRWLTLFMFQMHRSWHRLLPNASRSSFGQSNSLTNKDWRKAQLADPNLSFYCKLSWGRLTCSTEA